MHRGSPGGVVLVESSAEVQGVLRVLARHSVPFVARGAGTGLSGGAIPLDESWVIDVNRMRAILGIHRHDRYAVVEPGVVNLELDRAAGRHGLRFAPDPSSQKVCTLGGNVAENSGGPHCFLHGMTTRHILGMSVVLADGELVELGGPPGSPVAEDWRGIFVGSEGTFGVTVRIVAALIPRPEHIRTALATFSSLGDSCRAVASIIRKGLCPAALEILDRPCIRAVEDSVFRAGYPQEAEAVLLIEQEGSAEQIATEAKFIEEACRSMGAISLEVASDAEEREKLWRGRKGAFGAMGRLNPDLYVLDGVVPRRHLAEVIEEVQEIGRRHQVTLCNVFHAGDGNLHPTLSFDNRNPQERERVLEAAKEILHLCVARGGTLSGEHGVGLEKREFLGLVFNENDIATQKALRHAVDPEGRANPGKIFPTGRGCVEAGIRGPRHVQRSERIL
ncbi:MAG: FAD-linked oxidase C-terminal domain-containing protein [Planctomycetota bacterium]